MGTLSFRKPTALPSTGTANVVSFHPNADAEYLDIYLTSNTGSAIRHTMRKQDVIAIIAAADIDWAKITGAPATYAPSAHTQAISTVTGLDAALAAKSPLASPGFSGTPTAPTATAGTNTTQLATTAFVKAAFDALIAAAPGTLDTLNEIAAALGDDPNFATTITTALALKAPLASPDLTGNPTAPTQTAGNNTTRIATTAFVQAAVAASGGGDMVKATYDSTNNGKVDVAETAEAMTLTSDEW